MSDFQIFVGLPEMGKLVFKVGIRRKKTIAIAWHKYVPAKNTEEAKEKTEKALKEIGKKDKFYADYEPVVGSSFMPSFDGGERPSRWRAFGIKEGVPDQYVSVCDARGINLHIYKLGGYPKCYMCQHQQSCFNKVRTAGEQAEP